MKLSNLNLPCPRLLKLLVHKEGINVERRGSLSILTLLKILKEYLLSELRILLLRSVTLLILWRLKLYLKTNMLVFKNRNLKNLLQTGGDLKRVCLGGLLGAKPGKRNHPSLTRKMFCEDDQENLYNMVQDKATAGKQGLGIKDRPKKIAGVRYQGKKTSFDNSDDDEEEEEESEEDDDKDSREESEEEEDNKDSVIENSPSKRKRDEINEPKIKLKNLCKQILKRFAVAGSSGSMKLKQLKSMIDEQAPSILSEFSSRKDAIAYLKLKLERSEKFIVEGKKSVSYQKRSFAPSHISAYPEDFEERSSRRLLRIYRWSEITIERIRELKDRIAGALLSPLLVILSIAKFICRPTFLALCFRGEWRSDLPTVLPIRTA
ncbi:hypothetical protein Bca52824_095109 [Brassica carinata]|uniref:Cell growth-regulating nucleolar protein-like winged helix domain-containing protein n=1 Tax=Brassica carinata TaxID=52824 RepID=A0A8X7TJ59_BRACI|nr:hypothetical protein Bca52824_095109 [Brassica carinata]